MVGVLIVSLKASAPTRWEFSEVKDDDASVLRRLGEAFECTC
jgi:hypothetical protein